MDLESLESFLRWRSIRISQKRQKACSVPRQRSPCASSDWKQPWNAPVQTLRPACGADQRGRDFPALCQADGEYLEVCVGTPAADQADGGKRDTDHLLQHARNPHHTLADLPVPPVHPYITVINHIQYTRSAISDVIGEISPWAHLPACLGGHGRALLRAADGGPPCAGSPSPAPVGGKGGFSLKKSRKKPC